MAAAVATLALLACLCVGTAFGDTCGYYTQPSGVGQSGTISSPNYPNDYNNMTNCIWVIEVPKSVSAYIQLEVSNFAVLDDPALPSQLSNMSDALTVREGNSSAALLLKLNSASTQTSAVVNSTTRIMWIRFNSDYYGTAKGFTATWSVISAPFTVLDNAIQTCATYDYWCPNKQCVSYAYVCNGYNDCGVDGENDESDLNCLSLPLSSTENPGIYIGVPIAVGFLVIVILVGVTAEQQMQIINNQQAQLRMKEDEREEEKLMMSLSGKTATTSSGGEIVIISTSQRDVSADGPRTTRRGILRRPGEKKKVKLKARFNV